MNPNVLKTNSIVYLLAIPLFTAALWLELRDYVALWSNSIVYVHGFLVASAIVFLLLRRRNILLRLPLIINKPALAVLVILLLLLLFARAADVQVVRMALTPLIITAWGGALWGPFFIREAGPTLMLILFATPIWSELSPVLQYLTITADQVLLEVADIPAVIHDFYITIPGGVFHVADGCSGVRYFMVALFLAAFQGIVFRDSIWSTLLLMMIAALLSMLANWLRVFGIIFAGYQSDMTTSLLWDHELFGWIVFIAVMLFPFLLLSRHFKHLQHSLSLKSSEIGVLQTFEVNSHHWWRVFIVSLPLILTPSTLVLQDMMVIDAGERWSPALPDGNSDWRGPLRHANFWGPDYQSPDINLSGVYISKNLTRIQVQVVGYRNQTQGKELIHYRNNLFNESKWKLVRTNTRKVKAANVWGLEEISETVVESTTEPMWLVIWSWLEVGNQQAVSPIEAKLIGGLQKLLGDGRGVLWTIAISCSTNQKDRCEDEVAILERFIIDGPRFNGGTGS